MGQKKKALITWILGQDWPYLAQFLLKKWYKVYGMIRRYTNPNFGNTDYLWVTQNIEFVSGDMTDENSLMNLIRQIRPDEIYNLAAQSFVGSSWDQASFTTEVNSVGTLHLLNAMKYFVPQSKFYQASTSELFGNGSDGKGVQTENTPLHPRSPYAISKLYAYWMVNNFKESYGMFCCNWILFNHESPIRGKEFVTRKITDWVARIKMWLSDDIKLWNLDSKRDWGFAWDYVEAMYLIMQHSEPENFIVSTWDTHSIRDFLSTAFAHAGINDWSKLVKIDPRFKRPAELFNLQGSSNKAKKILWWTPKVKFDELVKIMVDADLLRYSKK